MCATSGAGGWAVLLLATLSVSSAAALPAVESRSPLFVSGLRLGSLAGGDLYRFDGEALTFRASSDPAVDARYGGITDLGSELLLSDFSARRILRVSPQGRMLGVFAETRSPGVTFLETDSSGSVYSRGFNSGRTVRYDASGEVSQVFGDSHGGGVDANAEGDVYVADESFGSSTISRYASSGAMESATLFPGLKLRDLAIDEVSDLLYAIDERSAGPSNRVVVMDIGSGEPTIASYIDGPAGSYWAAIDFDERFGTLVLSDIGLGSQNFVYELAVTGETLRKIPLEGSLSYWGVTALVVPEPGCAAALLILALGAPRLRVR